MATKNSTFYVELLYSYDGIPLGKGHKKIKKLYNGGDLVTKILNYFGVNFSIQLASDFYYREPILQCVKKADKNGKVYTIYSRYSDSYPYTIDGYEVIEYLEIFGVIPCSPEEAKKLLNGESKNGKNQ